MTTCQAPLIGTNAKRQHPVAHLDVRLKKLEKDGIKPEPAEDEPSQGRFAWIRDGEGLLVELWEPPGDR